MSPLGTSAPIVSLAGTALVRPEVLLQAQEASAATLARRIGAIKSIRDNALTLTPDSGPDVSVTVQPNARILRIAPGAKDLKDATPVAFPDLQVGDLKQYPDVEDQSAVATWSLSALVPPMTMARNRGGI